MISLNLHLPSHPTCTSTQASEHARGRRSRREKLPAIATLDYVYSDPTATYIVADRLGI